LNTRRTALFAAKKSVRGSDIIQESSTKGITVKTENISELPEVAPAAHKDDNEVVDVTENACISRKIVRTMPSKVIEG
jgi:RNA-splicing ligase RtcB